MWWVVAANKWSNSLWCALFRIMTAISLYRDSDSVSWHILLMVQLTWIKLARPFDGAAKIKRARPYGAAIYGVASLHVLLMVQLKLTSV